MTDTSKEAVEQAIDEVEDLVSCRCQPAFRLRGVQDPDCECDSAGVLPVLRALSAERDDLQAKLDEAVKTLGVISLRLELNADEMQRAASNALAKIKAEKE